MSHRRALGAGLAAALVLAGLPRIAFGLDCPQPPEQSRRDWDTHVQAAVGKIGPVSGAQLETRVRSATRDLLGRLPNADRVYLEQMMFSAYCSALRADASLPESAKARQVLDYRRELRRSLADAPRPSNRR